MGQIWNEHVPFAGSRRTEAVQDVCPSVVYDFMLHKSGGMENGMKFRPCIDIHNGKVKQIVGGTLKDKGDQAVTNFSSELDASYYAEMYRKDKLRGGHIILLNAKDSEYLVIGQRGALKRDAINTMLERLTKEIGMVNKLKPHTFRHTFCTRLINRGVPISTVSKLAGHSSVDTTATFYINSSREEKLKAVNLL